MRLLLPLLVALMVPGPSWAGDALTRLMYEPLLPSTRDALVQEVCAGSVTEAELRPLFHAEQRSAALDAARIAVCLRQADLIPLMAGEFTESQLGAGVPSDPDVFERLLRGLQGFPPETVRARLADAGHEQLVESIRFRFVGNMVQNLAEDPDNPPLASLTPAQAERLRRFVAQWYSDLLDYGEVGLQWLQTDSGGALSMLQNAVQFQLVAELIEHGSVADAKIGLELVRQLPGRSNAPAEALERRLAREDAPALRALAGNLPEGPEGPLLPTKARVYPVGPVAIELPPGQWLVPAGSSPLPLAVPAALVGLLIVALWALALRRWPRSRAVLFPVGALLLSVVGLLGVEVALTVLGVRPLVAVRPTFEPNQVGGGLYEPMDLEGEPHLVATLGGHRYDTIAVNRRPGLRRVVALGESSVHGTHYLAEEAFPALVEAGLDDVEVINVGLGGAVSDEILRTGLEALTWDPDLLIVYLGYNDLTHLPYMGRFRAYDAEGMARRRELGRWRLVRVLRGILPDRLLEAVPEHDQPSHLDEQEQTVEELLALTDLARENATANTVQLIVAARDQGVPVLLIAQASNEGACFGPPGGRAELLERGCYRDELAGVAREAARRTGVPLLEADSMFRAAAQARTRPPALSPWADFFWDGVHPTRLGHALLGEALIPVVAEMLDDRAP